MNHSKLMTSKHFFTHDRNLIFSMSFFLVSFVLFVCFCFCFCYKSEKALV